MENDFLPKPVASTEVIKPKSKEVIQTTGETLSSDFFLDPKFAGRIPAANIPDASRIAMKTGKAVIVTREE